MRPNETKRKLAGGGRAVGCFLRYPDAGLAELIALQGFDFLVLDGEHGTLDPRDCEHLVRACELRGATPLVRVPANDRAVILRFLDTGAMGAHIPLIGSAEEAEAALQAVKYAPRGARGLAGVRAADYGQTMPLAEYVEWANDETLVVIQIETIEAIEHVEAIAAVDGVDVIFIGPTDLSQALGVTGQLSHPRAEQAYREIGAAVDASGKTLGVLAGDAASVLAWRERGARYIAVTSDSLVARSAKALLAAVG